MSGAFSFLIPFVFLLLISGLFALYEIRRQVRDNMEDDQGYSNGPQELDWFNVGVQFFLWPFFLLGLAFDVIDLCFNWLADAVSNGIQSIEDSLNGGVSKFFYRLFGKK